MGSGPQRARFGRNHQSISIASARQSKKRRSQQHGIQRSHRREITLDCRGAPATLGGAIIKNLLARYSAISVKSGCKRLSGNIECLRRCLSLRPVRIRQACRDAADTEKKHKTKSRKKDVPIQELLRQRFSSQIIGDFEKSQHPTDQPTLINEIIGRPRLRYSKWTTITCQPIYTSVLRQLDVSAASIAYSRKIKLPLLQKGAEIDRKIEQLITLERIVTVVRQPEAPHGDPIECPGLPIFPRTESFIEETLLSSFREEEWRVNLPKIVVAHCNHTLGRGPPLRLGRSR